MLNVRANLVDESMYSIKCPYGMTPTRIVVHNTANDASAENEVAYMRRNDNEVSFHYAVDDVEAVQGVPIDRNTWNAGDGHGKGNMEGISIEICYSLSGGDRFYKALDNSAELVASLLRQFGWGIDRVTKHQDYNGKYCPHRILDEYGWDNYLALVESKLNGGGSVQPSYDEPTEEPSADKSIDELAQEVIDGRWGNGEDRKSRLQNAGYNYSEIQSRVNEILGGGGTVEEKSQTKSVDELAKEVINGDWGNGEDRKTRLQAAGYDYNEVQSRVNSMLGVNSKSNKQLAREVINGDWGNGAERKQRLESAGYDYYEIQSIVNDMLR